MSVHHMQMHEYPIKTQEAIWIAWIADRNALERRIIFRYELAWHDLVMSGEWDMHDVRIELALKVEEEIHEALVA